MNKWCHPVYSPRILSVFGMTALAVALNGCGGSSTSSSAAQTTPTGGVATAVSTFHVEPSEADAAMAASQATPTFHIAPVILAAPGTVDMVDGTASAHRSPALTGMTARMHGLQSRGLTLDRLRAAQTDNAGNATPMSSSGVTTYTPAQIRAAYGMAPLPANGTSLSASQAAALGAGQTIYIIDAYHDPNVTAELAAFNQSFGLPTCSTLSIASNASLPLSSASKTACQLAVVYANANSAMTSSAPAYDAGWATEITLDVQWAHATAPLARIVLIEATDPSTNALLAAVNVANAMGPGVVSMSFGAPEFSQSNSYDGSFSVANMTYLAATGDSGTGVQWPSVSGKVVAVGGTTLSNVTAGSRQETAWSDTGGGISAYVSTPSYQNNAVPGVGSLAHRAVADVAFNADPNTGQYLAVMASGASSVSWVSAGGTSLATPQWAGLVAVANAQRQLNGQSMLGDPHAVLYAQIGTSSASYAGDFYDITSGSDGGCASCSAHAGYDEPTGLGSPKVSALLSQLVQSTGTNAINGNAPVVTPAAIAGTAGVALSFTANVSAADPLTFSLSGQPSGMTVAGSGVVSWTKPVAGTYKVTIKATDTVSGQSASAVYTVTIAAATAPKVTAQSIAGKAGSPLSFTPVVSAQDAVTWSLLNAPSGMTISSSGVVSWAAPVKGNYSVTVTAKDTVTGLSGSAVFSVAIAAAPAPVVTAASISGSAGTALSFSVAVSAVDPVTMTLSGAPSGMTISATGVVTWTSPVAGNYAVTVTAKDPLTGLSGSAVMKVTISASGLSVSASTMTGKAGATLAGTIAIVDPNVSWLNVSIANAPLGMSFSMNGLSLSASWPAAIAGQYKMTVTVSDSNGKTATLVVPITVTQ